MYSKAILVIEDDPDDEAWIRQEFQRHQIGNELIVKRTGDEALGYLFGQGAYATRDTRIQPQLVILDLRLPGADGLEVLRRVRLSELTRTIPVVVLTASDADRDAVETLCLGATSFLRKPIDGATFLRMADEIDLAWGIVRHQTSDG